MSRIKINDIPEDREISEEEMKNVLGGRFYTIARPAGVISKPRLLADTKNLKLALQQDRIIRPDVRAPTTW